MCGFIVQLVEHRTGIRGGHGFESIVIAIVMIVIVIVIVIILQKTFSGFDRSIIPRQFPQSRRSPFLGSLIRCPIFQVQPPPARSCLTSYTTCLLRCLCILPSLISSAGIPSGSAAFPFFRRPMALSRPCLVCHS